MEGSSIWSTFTGCAGGTAGETRISIIYNQGHRVGGGGTLTALLILPVHLCLQSTQLRFWQLNSKALCNDFGYFQGLSDREPLFTPRLEPTF